MTSPCGLDSLIACMLRMRSVFATFWFIHLKAINLESPPPFKKGKLNLSNASIWLSIYAATYLPTYPHTYFPTYICTYISLSHKKDPQDNTFYVNLSRIGLSSPAFIIFIISHAYKNVMCNYIKLFMCHLINYCTHRIITIVSMENGII